MSADPLKITAVTPAQASKVLAAACCRRITEPQVRRLAEKGDLLRADGTFSLIEYTAWLAKETANG